MTTNANPFGTYLARARADRGWSAPQVARMLGVSDKQVYRYEAGKNEPSVSVAAGLADALGVSLDEIMGRAPVAPPDAELQLDEVDGANGAATPDLRVEVRVGKRRFIASTRPSGFQMVEPLDREGVDVEGVADVLGLMQDERRAGHERRRKRR